MSFLLKTLRIILGLVFLFSGIIKQNDPLGFSYKLEEYFHVFSLHFLLPYTLTISIFFCALETTLGILLIFKIYFKTTIKISFLLLVFFGFLTFYSAYFNKVKSCGCFGDVIILTPWQSFFKDLVLLLINCVLFYKPNINISFIKPIKQFFFTFLIFIASIYLGIYTYKYLPIIDFSNYKLGTNIQNLYNNNLLDPIAIDNNWSDRTKNIINNSYRQVILITSLDVNKLTQKDIIIINKIIKQAKISGNYVYMLTPANDIDIKNFKNKIKTELETYFIDLIFLRTLVRADNGVLILKKGIIKNKSNLTNFNINSLK